MYLANQSDGGTHSTTQSDSGTYSTSQSDSEVLPLEKRYIGGNPTGFHVKVFAPLFSKSGQGCGDSVPAVFKQLNTGGKNVQNNKKRTA